MSEVATLPRSRYSVNCSILLTGLPLAERPAAAARAGFSAVEFWWPFPVATPDADDVDAFVAAIDAAGVRLAALNLAAGDMPGGERGLVSLPDRREEFRANLDAVTRIAERTGTRFFNALYGNRQENATPAAQDDLAAENLALAAEAVARVGGTVLLEPVSGVDAYPVRTADEAVAVIERVASEHGRRVGLLLDVYHLAANGDDVDAAIERHFDKVAHVQIADFPGRGAPGTGEAPIDRWIGELEARGYDSVYGLEYQGGETPFAWLNEEES